MRCRVTSTACLSPTHPPRRAYRRPVRAHAPTPPAPRPVVPVPPVQRAVPARCAPHAPGRSSMTAAADRRRWGLGARLRQTCAWTTPTAEPHTGGGEPQQQPRGMGSGRKARWFIHCTHASASVNSCTELPPPMLDAMDCRALSTASSVLLPSAVRCSSTRTPQRRIRARTHSER